MKTKQKALITMATGMVLVLGFYMITNLITKYTGFAVSEFEEDIDSDLVDCLKQQDITLYINSADVGASLEENELVEYLGYFKINNCFRDNPECNELEINSFPTWIINDNVINGKIGFEGLAKFSGCNI